MKHNQEGLAGKHYRLYKIWWSMLRRCNDPKHLQFPNYGGRSITVCDEWVQFPKFARWSLTNGYKPNLSIDRKNNDEGYSPFNCRWATSKQQARNRRDNVLYEYKGECLTLPDWAERYDLKVITLVSRVRRMGWTMERALNERPTKKDILITAFGETRHLSEWSKRTGHPQGRIYLRIKRGWNPERALSENARKTR